MVRNLITSLLSLATNLLPSITASAHAPSSSSSSNNSERGRARAVEEDLERLMRTLERIKATLYDAEEREIRDRSVKLWLKELRKVAYDADDVLSEYQYEVTRVQVEARKASEASGLRNKCKLEILQLNWDYYDGIAYTLDSQLELNLVPEACEGGIVGADDVHFSLLECLQPHPDLKKLLVTGYPSTIVPGWMRDPLLLQSIEELTLESCGYIQSLPFSNLHTLKYLYIDKCSSIRTIQLEQLPSQLENFRIFGCDHLELITGFGHLDVLKELSIHLCKTLKSLTMDKLQSVESTELFGDLSHEIPQINRQSISSLTMLSITFCVSLHLLPDGLIPSGPCEVFVHGCGCPNYIKSNQNHEGSDESLSDEDIEDELDQLTYDNDCT